MMRTDAGKLRQMLVNLLNNAVKFTTSGEIVVRADARDDEVVFEVQDTGIGIDARISSTSSNRSGRSSRRRRARAAGAGSDSA